MSLKIIKQKRVRNNVEYVNFFACWTYQGKAYAVRVSPTFPRDYDKLYAVAEDVPQGEDVHKYI